MQDKIPKGSWDALLWVGVTGPMCNKTAFPRTLQVAELLEAPLPSPGMGRGAHLPCEPTDVFSKEKVHKGSQYIREPMGSW